ncbi:MAG TPA: inositol monophosphatase family protein [Streptosporangiaceae bacterium]|nr:inositol monophosphatase family protein [Streptosporangiaceae bacterium]
MLIDAVTRILQEAAEVAIAPRFRGLAEAEVFEKSPGQLVTVADREAEDIITPRLQALVDAPVVGEEAAAANPRLLSALRQAPAAWVVDPLDGTANFVAGRPEWAVMAALIRGGATVAGWIVRPADDLVYEGESGSGTWRNGARVRRAPASPRLTELRGAAYARFMDPAARARLRAAAPLFAEFGPGASCAGFDYTRLIDGGLDFVLFWRTLPWDHAPGTLLVTEAGATVRQLDGAEYRPTETGRGLLNAAGDQCWRATRQLLS